MRKMDRRDFWNSEILFYCSSFPTYTFWIKAQALCVFFVQNGLMSGLMQILLLKVSAHITEQLGMAPGGEFREAFKEVNHTLCTPSQTDGCLFSFLLCLLFFSFFILDLFPFTQAGRVPFCKFHLGDRPIPVTFKRAIAALSLWQKARLAWGLCFLSDPIRCFVRFNAVYHSKDLSPRKLATSFACRPFLKLLFMCLAKAVYTLFECLSAGRQC